MNLTHQIWFGSSREKFDVWPMPFKVSLLSRRRKGEEEREKRGGLAREGRLRLLFPFVFFSISPSPFCACHEGVLTIIIAHEAEGRMDY